jgi:signal transduction histidine kinase
MFRRLHPREEYEGMGMGLAVCKKIVERHGGQIGVKSDKKQGATFWVTLSKVGVKKDDINILNSAKMLK